MNAREKTNGRAKGGDRASLPTAPPWATMIWALSRAELRLLLRNRLQLFNALILPFAVPFLLLPLTRNGDLGTDAAARGISGLFTFVLLFVVYYNLLSSYVARREELVLKRLRTGNCPDWVILAGTAMPALSVALVQIIVLVVMGQLVLDLPFPRSPILLVAAVLLGAACFALLALITAPATRTVEAAQITSLPLIAVFVVAAGAAVPVTSLPDAVQTVLNFVPSAPLGELTQAAWLGTLGGQPVAAAAIGQAMGILIGWCALSAAIVSTYFRWEPRA